MRKVKTLFFVILTAAVFLCGESAFASDVETPSTTPSLRSLHAERMPPPLTLPPTSNPTVPGTDDDAFSPGLGGPRGARSKGEQPEALQGEHGRCRVGRMGSDHEDSWWDN